MATILAGASNVAISGGIFQINQTSTKSGFERLSETAAHSALHDAPARTEETRCLQHTRTNVIDRLGRWAQGLCDEGAPIFWLYGGAGAGKSAIMQTLAEQWVAEGLALGSFFFWRGDSSRNTAEGLIPTLAYQLAQHLPAALEVLSPTIERDPLVLKKSLQVQMQSLLVQPLEHLVGLGSISNAPQSPRVFLIDGLDECSNPAQQRAIIQAAAAVCHKHLIPVKFLIASRSEQSISTSFDWYKEENHALGTISLSDDPDAEDDIRHFIEAEFLKICFRHSFKKLIPPGWPTPKDIDNLVWKSSSHFIFASTVMKYLWMAKENPIRSLQVVLGLRVSRTISPFAELDALYHHILGSAAYVDEVLQILALCICTIESDSIRVLSFKLGFSESDICIYLADITPLVSIIQSSSNTTRQEVKMLHASLEDFLCDLSRAGKLHISTEVYLAPKLEHCFEQLDYIYRQEQLLKDKSLSQNSLMVSSENLELYSSLYDQIMITIIDNRHLTVVHQALEWCSLPKFYEWQLCLLPNLSPPLSLLWELVSYFFLVHSIKTSANVALFPRFAHDFLHILDTDISLKTLPLVVASFKLLFAGYPVEELSQILEICLFSSPDRLTVHWIEFMRYMCTSAELHSIQHSLKISSERLLVEAVEAILSFLFDNAVETDCAKEVAPSLFDALLWILPKAAPSQKVALYLTRSGTLQAAYPDVDNHLIRRVADCLNEYSIRVQIAEREELERRVQSGDVNALIEKSRIFLIDDQD